jgi:hypothetical protein
MGDRPDVGVIEIEAMRQGAIGERGERRRRGGAEQDRRMPLAPPPGRDLTDDAAGGLVGGADRDAEPVGQA